MTAYLTMDDAVWIHDEQVRLFGGASGARDLGLVESALQRLQSGYYGDVIEEAAALWESLAMNHGFVDGNKRVAFAGLDVFLGLNGVELTAAPADVTAFIYGHLEAGTFRKSVLEEWLRKNTVEAP